MIAWILFKERHPPVETEILFRSHNDESGRYYKGIIRQPWTYAPGRYQKYYFIFWGHPVPYTSDENDMCKIDIYSNKHQFFSWAEITEP